MHETGDNFVHTAISEWDTVASSPLPTHHYQVATRQFHMDNSPGEQLVVVGQSEEEPGGQEGGAGRQNA